MILGALLVLVTWAGAILALAILGLAPALVGRHGFALATISRMALWWGMLVATGAILVINLLVPLRSPPAAWAFALALAFMAAVAFAVHRWRGGLHEIDLSWRGRRWLAPLFLALALCAIFLAISALGPLTNYDSGLYHLGAVKYSGDFATIPGLANLYAPLGYNNSLFPLAAFLGNGPWDGIGYRLFNGLIMMLMASDLVLRLLQRKYTVGTFVMLIGLLASWVPLIALADYWVTSPTSDSAVMVLTFVSLAYLCDALTVRKGWEASAGVTVIVGLLLSAMRPIMAIFVLAVIAVIAVRVVRSLRATPARRPVEWMPWLLVAVAGLLLATIQTIRDYILSGWVQFPLSIWPFDVTWLATDPVVLRTLTLGSARDPANFREVTDNWSWVLTWLKSLPAQWEFYEFGLLALVAIVALVIARSCGVTLRSRVLLAALAPSFVTTVIWFVAAPPTFRMAWGPVFSLAVIPAAWAIHALYALDRRGSAARSRIPAALAIVSAVALVSLVAVCSATRINPDSMTEQRTMALGPARLGYAVTPIQAQPVRNVGVASGLVVLWPEGTDQCWDVYPLCTPWPELDLTLIGPDIQDGFRLGEAAP